MSLVYLCTPFEDADLHRHVQYARVVAALTLGRGVAAIHLPLYLQQVADTEVSQGDVGPKTRDALIAQCTELAVWTDFGVTPSMQEEISVAASAQITVTWFTLRDEGLHLSEQPSATPWPTAPHPSPDTYALSQVRNRLKGLDNEAMQAVIHDGATPDDVKQWLDTVLFR
jgi:hypothetical protein